MKLNCRFCNATIDNSDAFCEKCGGPVEDVIVELNCRFCGASIDESDLFCEKCGGSVAEIQTGNQPTLTLEPTPVIVYTAPPVAFAAGLPAWNIAPPSVVVRRKPRR